MHSHKLVRGMTKPTLQVEDKANAQKDKPAALAGDAAPQPNSAAAAAAAATPGPSTTGAATPRPASTLSRQGSGRAGGTPKGKDTPRTSGKTAAKGSKKVVPASFVEVIDCLVDVCLQYKGVQPGEEADLADPETSKDSAPFFEVGQRSSRIPATPLWICLSSCCVPKATFIQCLNPTRLCLYGKLQKIVTRSYVGRPATLAEYSFDTAGLRWHRSVVTCIL